MSTADKFVAIAPKRLLGLQDFRERMLDYMKKVVRDINQVAFGLDGTFDGPNGMSGFGANAFQIDVDSRWSDGVGNFLKTDVELAGRDVGIAFENTAATIYTVALHYAERPRSVQINPRTTNPEFVAWEETIGNRAEPDLVVDNGNGTMTFRVNIVVNPFGDNPRTGVGRKCLVWKKTPGKLATTEGAATEVCLVAFSGGNNTITTTLGGAGTFGQTAPSTTPSAYFVLLLGPTVTREADQNLEVEPGYAFVGRITGNGATPATFSITGQNQLGSGFAVDLNAITRLDGHGDLKILVQADVSDVGEPQIEVKNAGGTTTFMVDETGLTTATAAALARANITEAGFGGASETGKKLKTYGTTQIGTAEAQSHILRGRLQLLSDLDAILFDLRGVAGTERLGVGGASESGFVAKIWGLFKVISSMALGEALNAGAPSLAASQARLDLGFMNSGAPYNCLAQWSVAGGSKFLRIFGYGDSTNIIAISINAKWSSTAPGWQKDVNGDAAYHVELNESGHLLLSGRLAASDGTWLTNAWSNQHDFNLLTAASKIVGNLTVGKSIEPGRDLLGTFANLLLGRLTPNHVQLASATSATYTLLGSSLRVDTSNALVAGQGFRMYGIADGSGISRAGCALAVNAYWSESDEKWHRDVAAKPGMLIVANAQRPGSDQTPELNVFFQLQDDPGNAPWTEGSWLKAMRMLMPTTSTGAGQGMSLELRNAQIKFTDTTATAGDASNPPVGTGLSNTLHAGALRKGEALIQVVSGVVSLLPDLGFNVLSAVIAGSAPDRYIKVTFGSAFVGEWRASTVQTAGNIILGFAYVPLSIITAKLSATEAAIVAYVGNTGLRYDLGAGASNAEFLITAAGRQDT
jgi:hypothetical protein